MRCSVNTEHYRNQINPKVPNKQKTVLKCTRYVVHAHNSSAWRKRPPRGSGFQSCLCLHSLTLTRAQWDPGFPFFALFFKLSFLCWINWTFHRIFLIRFSAYYLHSYTTVLVIIGLPYVPWCFCLKHYIYIHLCMGLLCARGKARHPSCFRKELTFLCYHLLRDQLSLNEGELYQS